MTAQRTPAFRLEDAIRDPGFTPGKGDVPRLLERVMEGGEEATLAERALARAGLPAAREAIAACARAEVDGPSRARLIALIGRVAAAQPDEALLAFLLERLADPDAAVRKQTARVLGKLRAPGVADALAAALATEQDTRVRRSLVEAVGKAGGAASVAVLSSVDDAGDARVAQARARASLMAARTAGREVPSRFVPDRPAAGPVRAVLHCRAGLGGILAGELDADLAPRLPQGERLADRVEVTLTGAPARLFQARTMLSFGFPLPPIPLGDDGDVVEALVQSMASPAARSLLERWTEGPIRFRIAWAGGGKRRATVWRAAEAIAARVPTLINDPTESTWEAVVHEAPGRIEVELSPRLDDPRFTYRRRDVPAASHPTIAAALVRVAGVEADDVVWDPFVGSGAELCERALAGPYVRLIGSDKDPVALDAARENLEAAGVRAFELFPGDALSFVPSGPRPTLVLTNPPMGRRVLRGVDLGAFFDRFLRNVARTLKPGGRMAWVSPMPVRTAATAAHLGFDLTLRQDVDMGGFEAQIQLLRAPLRPRPAEPSDEGGRAPAEEKITSGRTDRPRRGR